MYSNSTYTINSRIDFIAVCKRIYRYYIGVVISCIIRCNCDRKCGLDEQFRFFIIYAQIYLLFSFITKYLLNYNISFNLVYILDLNAVF